MFNLPNKAIVKWWLRLCWICLTVILLGNPLQAKDKTSEPSDEQINAVYLYNFAVFVTWPDTVFNRDDSPFQYCVIDNTILPQVLTLALKGESINGHSLVATLIKNPQDKVEKDKLLNCHVIYIGKDRLSDWPSIRQAIAGKPILTVSNSADFVLRENGMISLLKDKKRIRPAINSVNVARTPLKVSAKLLNISKKVTGKQSNGD